MDIPPGETRPNQANALYPRNESGLPRLGATPLTGESTQFCVWAPFRTRVEVEIAVGDETVCVPLIKNEQGYFVGSVDKCPPGTQYRYRLDNIVSRPDPASAYQPNGVHHASQVVDHNAFRWTDQSWPGVPRRDLIIYELHVGTFTQQGTFQSAIARLPELVSLGVTAVELMPVAQFSGDWNWGYDGVDLFAVQNSYGEPNDLKQLVDACHEHGLAVILDVVYNHIGPEGNYLADFGPYFSRRHHSPWGESFNLDEDQSPHVRRFVIENALSWLADYHIDGLRLDAAHFIKDDSKPQILDELGEAFRDYQQNVDRTLHLIAETNVYDAYLLKENEHRPAYGALWSDCQMHAYYSIGTPDFQLTDREYRGAGDLLSALQNGYVYSGRSHKQNLRRRRTDLDPIAPERLKLHGLVVATQNHDAVGNHPAGKRIHHLTSPSFQKAAAALTLLFPAIPLLFMGEEFASISPFPFFVDFESKKLRRAVHRGRRGMFSEELRREFLSPTVEKAFLAAKLPPASKGDADMLHWYQGLIKLRRQGIQEGWLGQEKLAVEFDSDRGIFALRYQCEDRGHVLVRVRLASPQEENGASHPVPLEGALLLSSDSSTATDEGTIALKPNHAIVTRAY